MQKKHFKKYGRYFDHTTHPPFLAICYNFNNRIVNPENARGMTDIELLRVGTRVDARDRFKEFVFVFVFFILCLVYVSCMSNKSKKFEIFFFFVFIFC